MMVNYTFPTFLRMTKNITPFSVPFFWGAKAMNTQCQKGEITRRIQKDFGMSAIFEANFHESQTKRWEQIIHIYIYIITIYKIYTVNPQPTRLRPAVSIAVTIFSKHDQTSSLYGAENNPQTGRKRSLWMCEAANFTWSTSLIGIGHATMLQDMSRQPIIPVWTCPKMII